ncbi:MAG TPA: signal peptide prediction [Burkholderiales bacterium]
MRAFLRYVWASPATLVGLGVAGFALLTGARAGVCRGVLEVAGGGFGRAVSRLPPPLRFSALTLGHVVLAVDAAALEECRCHERVHVRQYERWGALFFPLYVGSSLLALLRGRDPYWENHFEREAYRIERGARCRSVSRAVRD